MSDRVNPTISQTELPPDLDAVLRRIRQRAEGISKEKYRDYGKKRQAPFPEEVVGEKAYRLKKQYKKIPKGAPPEFVPEEMPEFIAPHEGFVPPEMPAFEPRPPQTPQPFEGLRHAPGFSWYEDELHNLNKEHQKQYQEKLALWNLRKKAHETTHEANVARAKEQHAKTHPRMSPAQEELAKLKHRRQHLEKIQAAREAHARNPAVLAAQKRKELKTEYQGLPKMPGAFELAQKGIGAHEPHLKQAHQLSMIGAGRFPGMYSKQYMSPYEDAVVSKIESDSKRLFDRVIMPNLASQFIRGGISGGGHHTNMAKDLSERFAQDVAERQNAARHTGYQQAGHIFNADQARQLQAAQQQAELGQTAQELGQGDIESAANVGRMRQQEQQMARDLKYQDFLRHQQYPQQQVQNFASTVTGQPYGQQTVIDQQFLGVPQANTAGQLGGAAMNILGMRKAGMFKRGGGVRLNPAHIKFLMSQRYADRE